MYFSLAEAAQKAGVSRSSIYRLIDEGKLSATTDNRGKKAIELTELLRVFGTIKEDNQEDRKHSPVKTTGQTGKTGQDTFFSTVQELEKLRYELKLKDMELKLKDMELEQFQERFTDLKEASKQVNQEKNKLLDIIERQSLLLAAPRPQQVIPKARREALTSASSSSQSKPVKAAIASKTTAKPVLIKVASKAPTKTVAKAKSVVTKKSVKPVETRVPARKDSSFTKAKR